MDRLRETLISSVYAEIGSAANKSRTDRNLEWTVSAAWTALPKELTPFFPELPSFMKIGQRTARATINLDGTKMPTTIGLMGSVSFTREEKHRSGSQYSTLLYNITRFPFAEPQTSLLRESRTTSDRGFVKGLRDGELGQIVTASQAVQEYVRRQPDVVPKEARALAAFIRRLQWKP